ncbi:hypothetical protein LEN26_019706 [Aphanomyces euteiches]|nr:hypothetical protein LEN26_019706 [Aphanomyces euteiches]KAH9109988.1 hypothetical protein AeMF1_015062 [Aphanomyces euteiches]KAH9183660.1 hypothetical protein AeNC1_014364 [Aphanomyces euteiches]
MSVMKQAADNLAVTTEESPSHIWELLTNQFYSKDTKTVLRGLTKIQVVKRATRLFIPVFYILATSKSYGTYWNLLQYITDSLGKTMQPKDVVCDFKKALVNAVCDIFPTAQLMGCFFHFKYVFLRRMKKYRIPPQQVEIAMAHGVLDMLTVVDPSKVHRQGVAWVRGKVKNVCEQRGFEYAVEKWSRFWKYFERTWVRLFPPHLWNVHALRMDAVARTNNPLERFNREFNAAFGTPSFPTKIC